MYIYYVYSATLKVQIDCQILLKKILCKRHFNRFQGRALSCLCLYRYHFLPITHEAGTRKPLLDPRLNKTRVYLNRFISTQNHMIAG
jgi:hypothetical protein